MASISTRLLDNESRLAQLEGVPELSEAETVQKLEEVRQEQNSRQEELGARRERLTSSEQNRKGVLQKKKQPLTIRSAAVLFSVMLGAIFVSFLAFTLSFGKIVGKGHEFTNKIIV